jgi:hypothetical protein
VASCVALAADFFSKFLLIRDHFHHFCNMAGMPRTSHSFFKVIWYACVWNIWKDRNNRVFNNKTSDPNIILDSVKLTSFLWLKAHSPSFVFDFQDWWRHPLLCMGLSLNILSFDFVFLGCA